MTTDDSLDPLAGIDLQAWQPPAPAAGQVDAILARLDATRTDVAAAVELEPARPPSARDAHPRTRWLAIGVVIGAAAAALIAYLAWPARGPSPRPAPVIGASTGDRDHTGTHGTLAECRARRDAEDWLEVMRCANDVLATMPGDPDGVDLFELATRELANKLRLEDLAAAARAQDFARVVALAGTVGEDSTYADRARAIHDQARDAFVTREVDKAKALAQRGECAAFDQIAADAAALWANAGDAVRAVGCVAKRGSGAPAACDADALITAAREAGGLNEWLQALTKAQAADACRPSTPARQLAMLAACKLGSRKLARRYLAEFRTSTAMRQVCIGVVDFDAPAGDADGAGAGSAASTTSAAPACHADTLLAEARQAGGANMWQRTLTAAEASNRCRASKTARQLALLAACKLGSRAKALEYWPEFEQNPGMQQACIGVVE